MTGVRPVEPEDVEILADVLLRAFDHDPFYRWIFSGEAAWRRRGRRNFVLHLRSAIREGASAFTSGSRTGAALWEPPGHADGRLSLGFRLIRRAAVYRSCALHLYPAYRLLRARRPRTPHWYLSVLGVAPESQGRGLGSQLLEPVFDLADRAGIPAYLETMTEANLAFYRRHGFELVDGFGLPAGPRVWTMSRPAASDPASGEPPPG